MNGAADNKPAAPFCFEYYAYKWLDTALDCGITEDCYWNMTLAEVIRAVESKKRRVKAEAQEKATFDYILADLIGRSVSRIHSSSNKMPPINEVYNTLFDSKELEAKAQEKKNELSALRFKAFAQSFNNRYKGGAEKDE